MVPPAQPTHPERVVISIVMGVNIGMPADLAALFLELSCIECALNGEVSIVFVRIGSSPICLSGLTFDHHSPLRCSSDTSKVNPCGGKSSRRRSGALSRIRTTIRVRHARRQTQTRRRRSRDRARQRGSMRTERRRIPTRSNRRVGQVMHSSRRRSSGLRPRLPCRWA